MNRNVFVFILVIVLGLGVAIYVGSQKNTSDTQNPFSLINPPTPGVTLPAQNGTPGAQQGGTPIPKLTPVSATKGTITTPKGVIEIEFYPQDAPKTVTNFATLAKNKFYDGLTFHRVEPGFVVQGGDPNGNGTGGTSIYGGPFEDELNPDTPSYKESYTEGTIAMANSGPNTNGSQFFIMWQDHPELPHNYTIFGKVTSGMETVHKMVAGDKITSITVE